MEQTVNCEPLFSALGKMDFENWSATNPDCFKTEEIEKHFSALEGYGKANLGENLYEAMFRKYLLPFNNIQLTVWTDMQFIDILKIETEYPPVQNKEALMKSLGAVETILDYYKGRMLCVEAEYVYCTKGISILLNADKTVLYKIAIYPPCTTAYYREHLHVFERARRLK
ncbi:hypothetical protein [Mucilaginibacter sp. OK098]|uniref:hypothetical protein n=1 Tax=Mucilaginibacter sp. OK098 TaxID=1855297 RepID=UPI000919E868|nr:hypothetical protein [Mucilaginibacter sp. OK098]SHN27347.1 hypothetical protein SAMN05216524_10820 [Mucilaginibacter sp. OK098]